ncbi:MAG: HAMP domain-containing protein [Planctomycetes bacterium]|nr:HAMP domain-containing protein [Planctomycetota bacterium]
MTVKSKLTILIVSFVAGLALILGMAFKALPATVEESEYNGIVLDKDLIADILPPPEFIIEAHLTAWQIAHCVDVQLAEKHLSRMKQLRADYDTRHEFWNENLEGDEIRTAVLEETYEPALEYFRVVEQQLAPAALANDFERATAVLNEELMPIYERHREAIDHAVALATEHLDEEIAEASTAIGLERTLLGGVGLAVTLLGCILGWTIVTGVTRSARTVNEVMAKVAGRDLAARMDANAKDEFGDMARSLNRALDEVSSAMRTIRGSTDEVGTASRELQSAANEISGGAQESASSLEETAASLEEITSTIQQNADNAQQAAQLAKGASDTARAGGEVTTRAVSAMKDINEGSKKIADIITTIDEIAFQTNLLALNAAVEAARAGEQGRGFAVVASEVRNLAQRSAEAAKEIKGLIGDSLQRVERGSQLVDESGKRLSEIVESVQKVADIIAEIAAASREQSTGIEQLNTAVSQLDQVTQQNAAQTEELSSTAQQLSTRADEVRTLVGAFALGGAAESGSPSASAPAARATHSAPKSAARPAAPRTSAQKSASSAHAGADLERKLAEATTAVESSFEEF